MQFSQKKNALFSCSVNDVFENIMLYYY